MDFFKNFIASIIFTAAVLLFINVAGNILVGQTNTDSKEVNEVVEAKVQTEEIAEAKPEVKAQPEAPTPTPAAEQTIVASSSGNIEMGANTFRRKCMGCHPISEDGQNRTGPSLFGVVGRTKASIDGYRYSEGIKNLGGVWSEKELNTFIAGPRAMVPNTKMTFSGVKKEDQRDDIIAYLKTLSK
ncbi:MAG: cytochrome c family protein [Rhodospirillaceae bacterium]|nr:cytochrome c family protein [Rhodospirillaceae bacterium]